MRYLFLIPLFLIFSCQSNTVENDLNDVQNESTEIVMDEDRLDAVEINNELIGMYDGMANLINELFASDSGNVINNHSNALFEAKTNVQKLEEYQLGAEDQTFVESLKALMLWYEEELDSSFVEVIPLIQQTEISATEQKQLEDYDIAFAEKEQRLVQSFAEAQEKFAQRNNIRLE